LGVHPKSKRLERYKGTWIEGWVGRFVLEGPPDYLRLALEAGLGAKNSQGFGFVEEDVSTDQGQERRVDPRKVQ
ncbi:MAG: CRISPR-associated endoribonuclease Cas6, partial [Thermomicrobium sp.]|nr:CRISPR-associated endoribonuclease Cas6 [Thermomicrobium sp.]